jgi:hypothetical protein
VDRNISHAKKIHNSIFGLICVSEFKQYPYYSNRRYETRDNWRLFRTARFISHDGQQFNVKEAFDEYIDAVLELAFHGASAFFCRPE